MPVTDNECVDHKLRDSLPIHQLTTSLNADTSVSSNAADEPTNSVRTTSTSRMHASPTSDISGEDSCRVDSSLLHSSSSFSSSFPSSFSSSSFCDAVTTAFLYIRSAVAPKVGWRDPSTPSKYKRRPAAVPSFFLAIGLILTVTLLLALFSNCDVTFLSTKITAVKLSAEPQYIQIFTFDRFMSGNIKPDKYFSDWQLLDTAKHLRGADGGKYEALLMVSRKNLERPYKQDNYSLVIYEVNYNTIPVTDCPRLIKAAQLYFLNSADHMDNLEGQLIHLKEVLESRHICFMKTFLYHEVFDLLKAFEYNKTTNQQWTIVNADLRKAKKDQVAPMFKQPLDDMNNMFMVMVESPTGQFANACYIALAKPGKAVLAWQSHASFQSASQYSQYFTFDPVEFQKLVKTLPDGLTYKVLCTYPGVEERDIGEMQAGWLMPIYNV
eukprot:GHVS01068824.1.p1 GENE.GHVS01068824.1~~GHVS01068824.1.p1  ORF type:complete len:438 (+),score=44.23 GHVS01068824.1:110-1423(+)